MDSNRQTDRQRQRRRDTESEAKEIEHTNISFDLKYWQNFIILLPNYFHLRRRVNRLFIFTSHSQLLLCIFLVDTHYIFGLFIVKRKEKGKEKKKEKCQVGRIKDSCISTPPCCISDVSLECASVAHS